MILTITCRILIPPKLDLHSNQILRNYITAAEVREAIFNLNKDKSPGQDGITSEFYQKFWPRLVPILVDVYTNIFYTGQLANTMKKSLITLIYKKKGDPNDLKYWRPITSLTADYKYLSKILTSRLNNYINELLNPEKWSKRKRYS